MSEDFPSGGLYLPHARAALTYKRLSPANDVYLAHLAYRMSRYLENRGNYNFACTLAEQALELYREILGKEHLDTLTNMNNPA